MAGIAFLRRLLMKQAMKESAPFQHEGIMSISKSLSSNVDTKIKRWVESAKKQGQDIDKMGEQEIKYIIELNKPKGPKVISADSSEGKGITEALLGKKSADVLDLSGKKIDTSKPILGGRNLEIMDDITAIEDPASLATDIVTETITTIKSKKPIDAMKEANSVIGRKGKYKNLTEEQSQKIIKDTEDHIFEREIKPDPEDFAHGGRTGSGLNYLLGEDDQNSRVPYGKGKLVDVARRKFLQLMGGAVAGAGAAKTGLLSIFKGGATKSVIKDLASVPIKDISGMPVWFKPLVNRVIKEGDDVTKKFGTVDREIVHKTKLPDSQTDVIVTQDLTTGDVVVDIGMGKHGFKEGHLGQPVRLEYKAAEDIMAGPDMDAMFKVGERDPHIKVKSRDEMTFDQKKYPDKKPEEFWVEEAEFTGGHPENVKFEETISEKFGQHGSNFDEVEKFATGTVKKTKKTESRVFGKKYLSEGDDFASGGRVPLAKGKEVGGGSLIDPEWDDEMDTDEWLHIIKLLRAGEFGAAEGGRVPLVKGKIVKGIMSLGKKKKPKKIVLSDDDFNVTQGLDDLENMRGTKASEIMRIKMKYPGISDDLIRKIMTDDNPQRKAEVFATMDEAFKMQEKGMGHEEIIETFKGTTRTKNASGGRASLSAGGLAGLLGE